MTKIPTQLKTKKKKYNNHASLIIKIRPQFAFLKMKPPIVVVVLCKIYETTFQVEHVMLPACLS